MPEDEYEHGDPVDAKGDPLVNPLPVVNLSVFEEYGPHEDPGKAPERVTRVARCALLLCDYLKCLNYGI